MPNRATKAEAWRYHCRGCGVHGIMYFPTGYNAKRAAACPGCDAFMEVVERPKEEPESNVVNMVPARQAQMLAEKVSRIQTGNPMMPPDGTVV